MSQLGDDVALAFREAVAQRERAEKGEAELARVTAEAAVMREALQYIADMDKRTHAAAYFGNCVGSAQNALSSTSAGAGLLKRLVASEAVCEAAKKRLQVWTRDTYLAVSQALEAWECERGRTT